MEIKYFLQLLNRGVLENTNYSFHNYNPYNEDVTFPLSTVKEHVLQEGYELTPKVGRWINKVPYDLGNKEQKWSNVVYDALESSDIHIVIESHFDPFLGPNFEWAKKTYNAKNISPGFITEKVWKAVSCKKPFILAATPYILRDFKKLGYKTFDGFIDESYDEIEDDKLRLKALVTEVERINNLPSEEYQQLLEGVKEVVNYNHSLYIKQWESVNFSKYPFLHGVVVLQSYFYYINYMQVLEHDERPWGCYDVLLDTDFTKVKMITVKPGGRLSYQYHHKRAEVWACVKGKLSVILDDVLHELFPGDSIVIPQGAKHRAFNDTMEVSQFIETQTGTYFGEDDIVRLEDDYER